MISKILSKTNRFIWFNKQITSVQVLIFSSSYCFIKQQSITISQQ